MSRSTRSPRRGRAANPMRIPGFTAEHALVANSGPYRVTGVVILPRRRGVLAQFCYCLPQGWPYCICYRLPVINRLQ